jgi:hypothetical protein
LGQVIWSVDTAFQPQDLLIGDDDRLYVSGANAQNVGTLVALKTHSGESDLFIPNMPGGDFTEMLLQNSVIIHSSGNTVSAIPLPLGFAINYSKQAPWPVRQHDNHRTSSKQAENRVNTAPTANAGPDQSVAEDCSNSATVVLDASASQDAEGDTLSFVWTGSFGSLSGPIQTVQLPRGTYTVTLEVTDGRGGRSLHTAIITVAPNPNRAPLANAGPDQTVTADYSGFASVNLNGTGSSDPDGDILTYLWEGSFGSPTTASTSVTLPVGTHTVTLTARDRCGLVHTDTVVITVMRAPNRLPVANAGPDQSVNANSSGDAVVTLDGSRSSDPDNDPLTFSWERRGVIATAQIATVTLPVGVHTITLRVTDDRGGSSVDTVIVDVKPARATPPPRGGPPR